MHRVLCIVGERVWMGRALAATYTCAYAWRDNRTRRTSSSGYGRNGGLEGGGLISLALLSTSRRALKSSGTKFWDNIDPSKHISLLLALSVLPSASAWTTESTNRIVDTACASCCDAFQSSMSPWLHQTISSQILVDVGRRWPMGGKTRTHIDTANKEDVSTRFF